MEPTDQTAVRRVEAFLAGDEPASMELELVIADAIQECNDARVELRDIETRWRLITQRRRWFAWGLSEIEGALQRLGADQHMLTQARGEVRRALAIAAKDQRDPLEEAVITAAVHWRQTPSGDNRDDLLAAVDALLAYQSSLPRWARSTVRRTRKNQS